MQLRYLGLTLVGLTVGGCLGKEIYVPEEQPFNEMPHWNEPPEQTYAPFSGNAFKNIRYLSVTSIGGYAQSIATGDFNQDGKLDIVVIRCDTESGGDCTIAELLGDGRGRFQDPLPVLNDPLHTYTSLRADDIDDDGKVDLLTTVYIPHDSYATLNAFLKGNGDGTFAPPAQLHDDIETNLWFLGSFGNFGGDAGKSSVTCNYNANELVVKRHSANGFESFVTPDIGQCDQLILGDFDGNGLDDIYMEPGRVFLGNGNYGFHLQNMEIPSQDWDRLWDTPGVADLDGNGALDLLHTDHGPYVDSSMQVFTSFGHHNGTFDSPVLSYTIKLGAYASIAGFKGRGDLNGDGHEDLLAVIGSYDGGGLTVFLGDGSGGLSGHRLKTGSGIAVAGQFDDNSKEPEIVFAVGWDLYCVVGSAFLEVAND